LIAPINAAIPSEDVHATCVSRRLRKIVNLKEVEMKMKDTGRLCCQLQRWVCGRIFRIVCAVVDSGLGLKIREMRQTLVGFNG
jgi:hypothetical protein